MNPVNPGVRPPHPIFPQRRQPTLLDAIRGPVMLIALGALMAADQLGSLGIDRTWPALLILFGLLKVGAYMTGGQHE